MNKTTLAIGAFFVGLISVFLIQAAITKLWALGGITWGPENLPVTSEQQTAMLVTTGIAGFLGPLIALTASRHYRPFILGAFLVIGASIDLYAATTVLSGLPMWFRGALVAIIPLQLALAYYLAEQILPGAKKINK